MTLKKIFRALRRPFIRVLIFFTYCLGCLCYDKAYLQGPCFDRSHFTIGWQWILKYWFGQKILRKNAHIPWPVPPYTAVANPANIHFDPSDMRIFHTIGTYFQGIGAPVTIGKGTMIAPGVGLITANHRFDDVHAHQTGKPITIGAKSWLGMNAVILPGVCLGPETIVGAGAVVTHSFPEGHCVLAGNPARKIRDIGEEATPNATP